MLLLLLLLSSSSSLLLFFSDDFCLQESQQTTIYENLDRSYNRPFVQTVQIYKNATYAIMSLPLYTCNTCALAYQIANSFTLGKKKHECQVQNCSLLTLRKNLLRKSSLRDLKRCNADLMRTRWNLIPKDDQQSHKIQPIAFHLWNTTSTNLGWNLLHQMKWTSRFRFLCNAESQYLSTKKATRPQYVKIFHQRLSTHKKHCTSRCVL